MIASHVRHSRTYETATKKFLRQSLKSSGFQIEQPELFIPWKVSETDLQKIFDGQLLRPQQDGAAPAAVPVAASRITPPAKPARAGKPPIAQVPGSRGRLQGVAVVGGTNQLAIDARVTAP